MKWRRYDRQRSGDFQKDILPFSGIETTFDLMIFARR